MFGMPVELDVPSFKFCRFVIPETCFPGTFPVVCLCSDTGAGLALIRAEAANASMLEIEQYPA